MNWADVLLTLGLVWAGVFLLLVLLVGAGFWRLVRLMDREMAQTDREVDRLKRSLGR